jgi:aryl-alcohol dehydrogenase-like predicted oxidoreductase
MTGDRSAGEIMDYVRVGSTGVQVSPLCFGTMSFGSEEAGINFFDTADAYGDGASEKILGTLISDCSDEIVLGSKVFNPDRVGPQCERPLAPTHYPRGRGQPEAAPHRLA